MGAHFIQTAASCGCLGKSTEKHGSEFETDFLLLVSFAGLDSHPTSC